MRARKTIRVRSSWRSLFKCLSFRAQQGTCFSLGVGKKPVSRRCARRNDKMEERVTHPLRVTTWHDRGWYPMRFPSVQNHEFFIYLIPRNAAILRVLSDFLATTDLN